MDTAKQEPPSAFSLFRDDVLLSEKRENPDLRPNEITKLIAQKWVKLDETTRKKYEQKQQEYQDKFEQEKKPSPQWPEKSEKKEKITAANLVSMLRPFAQSLPVAKTASLNHLIGQMPQKSEAPILKYFSGEILKAAPAPKKPVPIKETVSALDLFKKDVMEETKKENPECTPNELSRIIAQKWVLSGEEVHKSYEKKLEESKLSGKLEQDFIKYEEVKDNVADDYLDSDSDGGKYNDYPEEEEDDDYSEEEEYDEDSDEEEERYEKEYEEKCYIQKALPKESILRITQPAKKVVKDMEERKPLSAFEMFKNDVFEETTKENPECNNSELLRIIAQKWTLSTDSVKEKYEKMCQQGNFLEKR